MNVLMSTSTSFFARKNTHSNLTNFLHAAYFSPVISTIIYAVKNNYVTTWPGLTQKLITKYLSKNIATAKGHINQEQKILQSTKNTDLYYDYIEIIRKTSSVWKANLLDGVSLAEALQRGIFDDAFPPPQTKNIKTNDVMYAIFDNKSGIRYMDLTGWFSYQSIQLNNYLMISYNYDANVILVESLKNRQAASIVTSWTTINKKLAGVQPNTYILDNECSGDLKTTLKKNAIDFQRVPPSCHRLNTAERAI